MNNNTYNANPFMNNNPFMNTNPFMNNNNSTNGLGYFQSFMNQDGGAFKSMQDLPHMDMSSFSNNVKNTAEIFSTASQVMSENIQSIFKRSSQTLQKNTAEMYNTMKDAMFSGDVNQVNSCQQKYYQLAMNTNFNNAKEVIDMSTKSLLEVINIMQKGFKENSNKAFSKTKHD